MILQLFPAVAAQVHGMLEAVGEIFLLEYNSGVLWKAKGGVGE